MRIVIAPDSYKGCLSAAQVAAAMARAVRDVWPEADTDEIPMADGGEGTVEALVAATGGRLVHRQVTGPLGEPVHAAFGILGDNRTAVIEMAQASGLPLVPPSRRDPGATTTYGTGELIRAALDEGCQTFIIGLGGSATNDAGAGMLQALGGRILDGEGRDLPPGGAHLARAAAIDLSGLDPRLSRVHIRAACDVDNPLCGPKGASAVFGPQKGASPEQVAELDKALAHFGALMERTTGKRVIDLPGAGAAGGLGAGLVAFLHATLERGVQLVAEAVRLRERVQHADLVLTGEGKTDGQTLHGKTPMGVLEAASSAGVPVILLSGSLGEGYEALGSIGPVACFSIVPGPCSLEEALRGGDAWVYRATKEILTAWRLARFSGTNTRS
ncbi:MAG: glycerate kinase [Alicyclobacillaceae bacterium]|nr:glycerate kinase [Alicyclobacillaceae bacterium]